MRYSRASSSHTSSPEIDYFDTSLYSPAAASLLSYPYTHPLDSYKDDAASTVPKNIDFMSVNPFLFDDDTLASSHFDTPQDLPAFELQQQEALPPGFSLSSSAFHSAWPQPGYNPFQQALHQNHSQHLAVQDPQSHRRALSNASSVPSYGAPDSPFSRASSVQYPTAYPQGQQYLHPQPMWDNGYSSPTTGAQHLPTPSHTPKSDTHMDAKPASRNTSQPRSEAAHQTMRRAQRTSSNAQDAPLTPRTANGDEYDAQSGAAAAAARNIPKFDRTISDACQDELYNPSDFMMPNPMPMQQAAYQQMFSTPQHKLINQRLNEAKLGRAAQLQDTRQASPFRSGSDYYGEMPYTTQSQPQSSAALQDPRAKAEVLAFQRQQQAQSQQQIPEQQPQTVSPKDAFPEQSAPEDENMPSLFPTNSSQDMTPGAMYAPHNANSQMQQQFARQSMPNNNTLYGTFATPQLPASSSQEAQGASGGYATANGNGMPDFPAHLASMETTTSDASGGTESPDIKVERPADTSAGSGTYTCTYHGCTERFVTPALLQKHKREAHRSTGAGGSTANVVASSGSASPQAASQQAMTQSGPHKCTRINPSTGKPCNTIFSRPYDLTRHEDTIHVERKKVHCPHCTEEKTFSRADALTRHLRVVHPQVSFQGKHRRRHA